MPLSTWFRAPTWHTYCTHPGIGREMDYCITRNIAMVSCLHFRVTHNERMSSNRNIQCRCGSEISGMEMRNYGKFILSFEYVNNSRKCMLTPQLFCFSLWIKKCNDWLQLNLQGKVYPIEVDRGISICYTWYNTKGVQMIFEFDIVEDATICHVYQFSIYVYL